MLTRLSLWERHFQAIGGLTPLDRLVTTQHWRGPGWPADSTSSLSSSGTGPLFLVLVLAYLIVRITAEPIVPCPPSENEMVSAFSLFRIAGSTGIIFVVVLTVRGDIQTWIEIAKHVSRGTILVSSELFSEHMKVGETGAIGILLDGLGTANQAADYSASSSKRNLQLIDQVPVSPLASRSAIQAGPRVRKRKVRSAIKHAFPANAPRTQWIDHDAGHRF